jgi:YVTN family beta-propeller protein
VSRRTFAAVCGTIALLAAPPAWSQGSFVNWESPHVHPLELGADGETLLAVNTADNRLELFDVSTGTPVPLGSIPVGLDPVSVRARTSRGNHGEAWVANHLSDSVSVVDLATRRVVATLACDDEPADVIFAGTPERAFVSCSQANTVLVFDPEDLDEAPTRVAIGAEDPRALAKSPDGEKVYVAVFESGNGSTILGGGGTLGAGFFPPNVVNHPSGPYGGQNPPPNQGASFNPPINPALPAPPRVGLIVKQDSIGRWLDDNAGNWTSLVSGANAALSGRPIGWQLLDRDVAVLDADTLSVSYVERLMNACMAIAVNPSSGDVFVTGTDGTNQVRFEPVLSGRFLRVNLAQFTPGGSSSVSDLNPHLTYASSSVPQAVRDLSLGDPRGIAWNRSGTRAYVTGMGSNNLVVLDSSGDRVSATPIEVGEGPTGVVVASALSRVFVLNKFEASISAVDVASEAELARVSFYDPSPQAIRIGRKHLYDTHKNSGLGHIACASCHIDARMDRLAWDLGDPSGSMRPFNQNCPDGGCQNWHPMKGPMLTQTLQDIIGREPHHWRGDRNGIEEFNGAFLGLQGDDQNLTPAEMQQYESFLATIHFPPNPFRNFNNSLPTSLPLPGHFTTGRFGPAGQPLPNGNAVSGLASYRPPRLLDGGLACITCHTLQTGMGTDNMLVGAQFQPIPPGPNGERHHALVSVDGSTNVSIKIPHLRNLYERVGFDATQSANTAGFGFLHDGSVDSIARFVSEPVFSVASNQEIANLVAFMLAFSGSDLPPGNGGPLEPPGTIGRDTHAAVGAQATLRGAGPELQQHARIDAMEALADAGDVGLVVRGVRGGKARGYAYQGGGLYLGDRSIELVPASVLRASAAQGGELTYTVVPKGSETRIGIDRDDDGAGDGDELDAGSDPADPVDLPPPCADVPPAAPASLVAQASGRKGIQLTWTDGSSNETGFLIERRLGNLWVAITTVCADETTFVDTSAPCGATSRYRVRAFNCAGASAPAQTLGTSAPCIDVPSRE